MNHTRQAGFHIIEAAVILFVIAAIGFVGFRIWELGKGTSKPSAIKSTQKAISTPAITNSKDLDSANSAIDQLNNTADTQDLNSLDQDLNNL